MMIFTPVNPPGSNESSCYALEQVNAVRPPRSDLYIGISWAFFAMPMLLWGSSIIVYIILREHSRFKVVRPLPLNIILCLSQMAFAVAMGLNQAILTLPCALLVICIMGGFSGFGVNYFVRLLIYVIRSQYAMTMHAQIRPGGDSDAVSVTTGGGRNSIWSAISAYSTLLSILKLLFNFTSLQDITVSELFATKQAMGTVAVAASLPGIITTVAILGSMPVYQTCVGCSIYLEVFIGFMITLAFYIGISSRILFMAWKLKFPGTQGVFKEFAATVLGVGTLMAISVILIVVDPNSAESNNTFAFEWLFMVATIVYWWIAAGSHFLKAYRQSRNAVATSASPRPSHAYVGTEMYMSLIRSDDSLRQAFTNFVVGRYAVENLYFAQDVDAYKLFFFEKAPNWRKSKASFILSTYVLQGSPMEINVSHKMQDGTIDRVRNALDKHSEDASLLNVFDDAYDEITTHVLRGLWQEFALTYVRSKSTLGLGKSAPL